MALKKSGNTHTRQSAPPLFIEPARPRAAITPPTGPDWFHEIKYDGYRVMARLESQQPRLMTRGGHDWTARFRTVAQELAQLKVSNAYLDGEMIATRPDGTSSFRELPAAMGNGDQTRLRYFVFDLLHLNGHSLRYLPLHERKAVLRKILPENMVHVQYVDHLTDVPPNLMTHVQRLGAEGIVCKRMSSVYDSGTAKDWLKIKCYDEQELVIGGFTGSHRLSSLLVGYYKENRLHYAGRVAAGFPGLTRAHLHSRLSKIARITSPFAAWQGPPAIWVTPKLVAQIRYLGLGKNETLQHASFRGLREDKSPRAVAWERLTPGG